MSGFETLLEYSAFKSLLAGLVGYFGILGSGLLLTRSLRLPAPWDIIVGLVPGVLVFSLGCQLMAFLNAASRPNLAAWFLLWTGVGLWYLILRVKHGSSLWAIRNPWQLLFLVPVTLLVLTAACPSTKIDELFYHMLVPARVVADGTLTFYQFPWQAAVPQMSWQIGLAPLHAIGFPHAGNVCSALIAGTMACCCCSLVRQRGHSEFRASAVAGLTVVGMYPAVWYVTGGAHALGDFCMAFAIVACASPWQCSQAENQTWIRTTSISLLLAAAAATKVSLLPLAALLQVWVLIRPPADRMRALNGKRVVAGLAPWMLLIVPLLVWTWQQSGAPFGPMFSGWFEKSVYDSDAMGGVLERSRAKARQLTSAVAVSSISGHSAAFWLLAIAGLFARQIPMTLSRCALMFQILLVATVLPLDLRFLGGTHVAIVILSGMNLPHHAVLRNVSKRGRRIVALVLLVPWFSVQLVYQLPFLGYMAGLKSHEDFCRQYIAMYDDFRRLDRILPKDASILSTGIRPNSIYFPRRILVRKVDVQGEHSLFLFACDLPRNQLDERVPAGYDIGEKVYGNEIALLVASRVPGVRGTYGRLDVYRLHRQAGHQAD